MTPRETPVTDALFEKLAAQDGPENLYTDEQVEIIQLRMGGNGRTREGNGGGYFRLDTQNRRAGNAC